MKIHAENNLKFRGLRRLLWQPARWSGQ